MRSGPASLNTGKMPHIRSDDIKLQSAQNTYIIATLPIIRLAHSLVSARENPVECKIDTEKALQDCMESLMLQAAGHSQLNNFRRDHGHFAKCLLSLAADPIGVSKLLFGDNLDKRIQDINAQSKIKSSLASNGQGKISYRSSGGNENSHHLHKREHYTKIFNSFPSHQKSTRLGEASTQKEAGFINTKITLLEVIMPMVNLIFLCTYSDKNLISMWVVTYLIILNSGLKLPKTLLCSTL